MSYIVPPLSKLIDQFAKLPGIGRKTAGRLAFHVLNMEETSAKNFASAILEAKEKIHLCRECQALTDSELCSVCSSHTRDKSIICVVEDSQDIMAFERTKEYNGIYHVLGGLISPMDGITPDRLKIKELLARINDEHVKEIIMATNPTVEGEATAMYISRLLKTFDIKVSRLAYGIPVGGDLQYADEITLMRALEGRNTL